MKTTKKSLGKDDTRSDGVLHLAFELSQNKWKLGFGDGERMRFKTIEARDLEELREEIERAKERFKLRGDVRIVSCYEAGRDGFWLHRYLRSCGVENVVVDSSSIEVDRRKRRAKTDRIDAPAMSPVRHPKSHLRFSCYITTIHLLLVPLLPEITLHESIPSPS